MSDKKEQMTAVPGRRLHPTDGLAVTARIWATAHDYHHRRLHAHQALAHAPGVLLGLDVIASDPPDSTVYILPGIALAPDGEFIVVKDPVAYDLGTADGPLTLWLTYAEGQPHSESDPEAGEVTYVRTHFGVEAQPGHVAVKGVELARMRRTADDAPLTDAEDAAFPQPDEIDLRFRREITASLSQPARMAVIHWGGGKNLIAPHVAGAKALGRALRQGGDRPLWVDVDVSLEAALDGYTVLYLVAGGADVEPEALNTLYEYLQNGGTVFIEVSSDKQDEVIEAAVFDMLGSLGISPEPVPVDHPLLTTPHLFAVPPGAKEEEETPTLLAADGVIFSRAHLGVAWRGQRDDAPLTRSEIRAAHEWGENLIHYGQTRNMTHEK